MHIRSSCTNPQTKWSKQQQTSLHAPPRCMKITFRRSDRQKRVAHHIQALNSPVNLYPVKLQEAAETVEGTQLVADPYGYFPRDEVAISPWVWAAGAATVVFALVKLDLLGVKVEVKPYEELLEELREEKIAAMRERGELLTEAEYKQLLEQQAGLQATGQQATADSATQQLSPAQLSAQLEEMIRSGKMQLPDDDMGRIVICAALIGRQRDVKQQQEFYTQLFTMYKDAFGANITGMLLLYPHCCIHIIEADCHVIFDVLRALTPARQGHHQVRLDQARVLHFEPGITRRSFSSWNASFMSFAKPASAGVVLDTDKWVEAARQLKGVSEQVQRVMMKTPEADVPKVLADVKKHVPDLPDSQTVLSLAVTEEAESIELFLEYFDFDYDKMAEEAAAAEPKPFDKASSPFAHLYPKAQSATTSDDKSQQLPPGKDSVSQPGQDSNDTGAEDGREGDKVVLLSSSSSGASQTAGKSRKLPFTSARSAELEERFSRLLRNAESISNAGGVRPGEGSRSVGPAAGSVTGIDNAVNGGSSSSGADAGSSSSNVNGLNNVASSSSGDGATFSEKDSAVHANREMNGMDRSREGGDSAGSSMPNTASSSIRASMRAALAGLNSSNTDAEPGFSRTAPRFIKPSVKDPASNPGASYPGVSNPGVNNPGVSNTGVGNTDVSNSGVSDGAVPQERSANSNRDNIAGGTPTQTPADVDYDSMESNTSKITASSSSTNVDGMSNDGTDGSTLSNGSRNGLSYMFSSHGNGSQGSASTSSSSSGSSSGSSRQGDVVNDAGQRTTGPAVGVAPGSNKQQAGFSTNHNSDGSVTSNGISNGNSNSTSNGTRSGASNVTDNDNGNGISSMSSGTPTGTGEGRSGSQAGSERQSAEEVVSESEASTATATAIPPKSYREEFESGEGRREDKQDVWSGLKQLLGTEVVDKSGGGMVVDVEVVGPGGTKDSRK